MQVYEDEVRPLEGATLAHPPPKDCVVFYGSSSIRLWTTLAEDFPGIPVVNRGFGGSTLAACSWFFWRLVRPLPLRSLIVYAGDNDLGDGQSPTQVLEQLAHLLRQAKLAFGEVPLAFMGIKPSPARFYLIDAIRAVNCGAKEALAQHPGGIFVDTEPVMLSNGKPRVELYEADGLHLSRAGYEVWRDLVHQYRVPLLANA